MIGGPGWVSYAIEAPPETIKPARNRSTLGYVLAPGASIRDITVITEMWPIQNGRHFADDIFICIFLNRNVCIFISISPNFIPIGPM